MAILEIVKYPDPVLREISREVQDTESVRDLARDMAETMYAHNGAGLAAIQVARAVTLFIIDAPIGGGSEEDPPIVFINPEILELSEEQETNDEGCLSFPGIYVPIPRSQRVRVRATDLDGQQFEVQAEGLYARAIQHENDHLNGRLIADFVGRIKRQLMKRQLARAEAE
jgi:peptide deformylase